MDKISSLLDEFKKAHDPVGSILFPGASGKKIENFSRLCEAQLNTRPPLEYLNFLKRHDGFTAEGVNLYSSSIERVEHEGELAFLEMNILHRELPWNREFLFFGDSDMDVYVLDLKKNIYQVRDKQAFDNIYESFGLFQDLLKKILEDAISRM